MGKMHPRNLASFEKYGLLKFKVDEAVEEKGRLESDRGRLGELMHLVLCMGLIVSFTSVLSFTIGFWAAIPPGWDTCAHMTKIQFLLQFWPYSRWGFFWALGSPIFRWYPPLVYYLIAGTVVITRFSAAFSLTLWVLLSMIITSLLIFLTVRRTEGDYLSSLIASLIPVGSTIYWAWGGGVGMIPRTIALAPLALYFYLLVRALTSCANRGAFKRFDIALLVCALSLTTVAHPLAGIVGSIVTFLLSVAYLRRFVAVGFSLLVLLLSIGLSSWFLVPFMSAIPSGLSSGNPVSPDSLRMRQGQDFSFLDLVCYLVPLFGERHPNPGLSGSLSPIALPLMLGSLAYVVKRSKRILNRSRSNLLTLGKAFCFVSAFFLVYPFAGVDASYAVFSLLTIPIACGFLLSTLKRRALTRIAKVLVLIAVIFAGFVTYPNYPAKSIQDFRMRIPTLSSFQIQERSMESQEDKAIRILLESSETGCIANYRFGIPSDSLAKWFNWKYPSIPQTRQYFGQGILYPYWVGRFEGAVWGGVDGRNPATYEETNFFLDWFAVRWCLIYPPYNASKYLRSPNLYEVLVNGTERDMIGFRYKEATFIASATNSPSILLVGGTVAGHNEYLHLIEVLTLGGWDSRFFVPVRGKPNLDDYSVQDLRRFDAVVLYGFGFQNHARAWQTLEEYVRQGGSLFIDTGLQYSSAGYWNSSSIPSPSPVKSTIWDPYGTEWKFSVAPYAINAGIDFARFSPSELEGQPWGISISTNESLQRWAQTVVWVRGSPALVVGELGSGRVVWSGINLPFHASFYKNSEEAKLIKNILDWTLGQTTTARHPVAFSVNRRSPEKVIVKVDNSSRGVLLKEFYFEDWKARVISSNGESTSISIQRAGTDVMFVPIPTGAIYPIEVAFEYSASSIELAGSILSICTFIVLLASVFHERVRERRIRSKKNG